MSVSWLLLTGRVVVSGVTAEHWTDHVAKKCLDWAINPDAASICLWQKEDGTLKVFKHTREGIDSLEMHEFDGQGNPSPKRLSLAVCPRLSIRVE